MQKEDSTMDADELTPRFVLAIKAVVEVNINIRLDMLSAIT